jgi:hypothetical protein
LDKEPMDYEDAVSIAATLVGVGYQARTYSRRNGFGYTVVVTGKHGNGPRFRYVITDPAQLSKALDDLARGETGGDKALWEGV